VKFQIINNQILSFMKRINLLCIAIFVSAMNLFAGDAFDNAYWVIKDGKLVNNVSIKHYDNEDETSNIPDELIETTKDGVNAIEFKKKTQSFLDPRILFDTANPLNLNTHYIMVMEYMIPSEHAGIKILGEKDGNKPIFIIGFAPTEKELESPYNAPHCPAAVYIDAKWGVTDQWVSTYKYVFANPSIQSIQGIYLTYAREYNIGDLDKFPYIRNLYFISTSDNVKPFYAENFTFANYSIGEFYGESYYIHHPNAKQNKKITDDVFHGGIRPVITEKDIENEVYLHTFRNFIPNELGDCDGSGYMDDEILQALLIESADVRDSVVIPGIKIPAGASKIYSEMLTKKYYKYEDINVEDPAYPSVANADMPIKFRFNTGEIVDVAKDTMKMIWTKYKGEVDVPTGATTVDLIFTPMACAYLVDEIFLSASPTVSVKDIIAENNDFEIVSYVDGNGNIIVLNGEIEAMYNMNGKPATINDKIVVIVVKNEEGKKASKIIVR